MEESYTELYSPTYANLVRNSLRLRYYKCINILYLYRLQLTNPSLWRRPRTPQSSSRDFLGEMVESLDSQPKKTPGETVSCIDQVFPVGASFLELSRLSESLSPGFPSETSGFSVEAGD